MTQIDPINWRLALLIQNPFLKVPPSRPEEAIWAGFSDLKKQLDTAFLDTFTSSSTQIILNRGAYGSGKTHAAFFCQRKDYLAQFLVPGLNPPFAMIYSRTPIEHEKADVQLCQQIIEALGFKNIRILMRDTITELGPEAAQATFQRLAGSETLGKVLWLLGHKKTRSGRLVLFQDEDMIDNHHKLLERYLYSQNTKSDLKRLDLSYSIGSVRERFQVLSTIFRCFIGLEKRDNIMRNRRIIMWIDRTEELIQYHPQYFHPFIQGLQVLIDRLPHYFTLFINLTAAPHVLVDYIETALGRELTESITKQIFFREPSEDEALEYVKDLMRHYRTEDFESSGLPATYPFKEDALRLLIDSLYTRTPHYINQYCAEVIEAALKQGVIHDTGEGTIDVPFVRSVEDQRLRFDMG